MESSSFYIQCSQYLGIHWFPSFAAAVVKFSPLSDTDSSKRVETGDAIVLYCEVSHPFAQVSWFKDGKEILMTEGLNIQSDGNMRRIVIQSADASHSGVYTCETSGDQIEYNVEVAGKIHYHRFTQNHGFIRNKAKPDFLHFKAVFSFVLRLSDTTSPSYDFRSTCGVLSSPR